MGRRPYRKDVAEAIAKCELLGFTLVIKPGKGARHVQMVHRNGGTITFPKTPSAPSWRKNHEADARRVARGGQDG